MQKGDVIHGIRVETMASEGKCVGHHEGRVVFMTGGAPGDVVDAVVYKVKPRFLEARVTQITSFSPDRAEPFCQHFGTCGGCSWQHIQYDTQLRYKQKQVVDNLERIGGVTLPSIRPIIPSPITRYYRNRLDFTFSARGWVPPEQFGTDPFAREPALGYHLPRKYDKVFDVKECHLQADPSNAIRLATREEAIRRNIPFFDLRNQVGFLRTLTIRSTTTGQVMVILQVTYDKQEWIEALLQRLERDFPQITSFNYLINGKRNDTFNDLEVICWKGNPWITETMPEPNGKQELRFRIGPKSFYQTNSVQAERLYRVAWEMANLQGHETVYDLYTGTGTIACYVARSAGKVIGLEYVADAVEDARANAKLNDLQNVSFFAGDIRNLLDENFLVEHGRPDVVITDPPRAGMHEDVCRMLIKAGAKRIIYVSCNPATQARDLSILYEKYRITDIQPVDMFPHTMHVENVVAMEAVD
jgi:23S rRNA (uracil1939-C5)-methyltransferase